MKNIKTRPYRWKKPEPAVEFKPRMTEADRAGRRKIDKVLDGHGYNGDRPR